MSILTRNIIISLVITGLIIGTVVYAINYLNQQRVTELNTLQNQLATDTLSLETQFSLLETAPCEDLANGTELSQEVSSLGDKLAYTENKLGSKDEQVIELKEQYTLLEIRDYILTKQLTATCHTNPIVVLYFYSNNPGECTDCDRASYALSYLHQTYPNLRVYSFDYNLNLGALKTLESIEKLKPAFPAFIIQGKTYYGFDDLDSFKKHFPPALFATSTATSTVKK